MTVVDFEADRSITFSLAGGFRAVGRWIARRRSARARRNALRGLLFASDHRLRDLGISRDELIEAIEGR